VKRISPKLRAVRYLAEELQQRLVKQAAVRHASTLSGLTEAAGVLTRDACGDHLAPEVSLGLLHESPPSG
jgi:hypothetical protein